MEKRTEQKKQRSDVFKQKMQKIFAIFFCIALLVFFITAADMSTRRMIMVDDDKYALAVSLQEGSLLRVDIAGEKYLLDVEPVIRLTDTVVSSSKRFYESTVSFIRNRLN